MKKMLCLIILLSICSTGLIATGLAPLDFISGDVEKIPM